MAFKFGSLYINETRTVELTTGLARPSVDVITNALLNMGYDYMTLFEESTRVGYVITALRFADGECYLHGGRTGLHDACELIVDEPYPFSESALYPGRRTDISLVHTTEQGTTQIDGGRGIIVDLGNSTSNTTRYEFGLLAIPYQFVNEVAENTRRKGYLIYKCTKQTVTNSSGSVTTSYIAGYLFRIDIPYWNYFRDLDMYWEDDSPEPEPDDPNDEDDPADEGGGDGDHTPIYDPVPIPDRPSMGAANAGFITMYKLGLAAINVFASDMFASGVWEAIKLFFSNPIDFLVGCMLLPFEPDTGSSYHPKFGIVAFEHAYPAISNQYKDIDCGSINITKYWGSCFDYEPFTKIQIWLPYIGYRDLPVDEIMDMTVSVKYRCDCLTGDCVAFVYTGVVGQTGPQVERVIAQFYGNCGVRVPFGSVSYDSAVAASIQLMGAAASIGLSPGAHGTPAMQKGEGGKAFEGIVSPQDVGLINAGVNVVTSMKPTVQKGGAAGSSTGYMSIQTPYIIRRIPRQNLPSNFMHLKGYPSNIGGTLSQFTGLAVVDDIQLNNIPAMEDERKEIIAWLKGGVLI